MLADDDDEGEDGGEGAQIAAAAGGDEEGEGKKEGGGLSARARLLSERLGKEGTRRRRAALAEEMEALPGACGVLVVVLVLWMAVTTDARCMDSMIALSP